ncbi:MAG: CheY-like chemotaxis protein [Candidatus Latescibacterota bacterium]|jgi:CheY-like chemotaxis protein
MRVLIVDDDRVTQRVLLRLFESWNFEVLLYTKGCDALKSLQSLNEPTICIIDWVMPEMSGIELCKLIQSQMPMAGHYLILLTGKGREDDIVEGLGAGADDYVIKPFHLPTLKARVDVGVRLLDARAKLITLERDLALRQTAGGAAHELNQPLTILVGKLQHLLFGKKEIGNLAQDLEMLLDQAMCMSKIINDMGSSLTLTTTSYVNETKIATFDIASQLITRDLVGARLVYQNQLLRSISEGLCNHIVGLPNTTVYKRFLEGLICATESEFGFLGGFSHKDKDVCDFKIHALAGVDLLTKPSFPKQSTFLTHCLNFGKPTVLNRPNSHLKMPIWFPKTDSLLAIPFTGPDDILGIAVVGNGKKAYVDIQEQDLTLFSFACTILSKN